MLQNIMKTKKTSATEPYDSDDIELYYTECGDGYPLILLHGNGESSEYFAAQIKEFSKYYRVIAVDSRGHGKSPRGGGSLTLSRFADDLLCLMRRLEIEKAHILGFSDGANVGLIFALRYPERVGRLILNGGNLSPGGVKTSVQLPIILGYAVVSLIAIFDHKAQKNREILGLMVTQPDIKPSELEKLCIPVLVIAGKRDMIKESHTKLIASSIHGSRLRIIDGDHFIASGNSAEFNREVLDFLSDV